MTRTILSSYLQCLSICQVPQTRYVYDQAERDEELQIHKPLVQVATYPYPDEIPDGPVNQSIAMTPIVSEEQ